MTINKTILSKSQADALFQREAVLIGNRDVVPESRLADLLGAEAVKHTKRLPGASAALWNAYGIGGASVSYFTYRGFLEAVTYSNLRQLLAGGDSSDA